MDAACKTSKGLVAFEWETGNVSSSHRSLNKMALGLSSGSLVAGILVVPSRKLYPFLTDRIGNYDELKPYFPLWSATPCQEGVLEILVVEQDAESFEVAKIPKERMEGPSFNVLTFNEVIIFMMMNIPVLKTGNYFTRKIKFDP